MAFLKKEKIIENNVLYFLQKWFGEVHKMSGETWETFGNLSNKQSVNLYKLAKFLVAHDIFISLMIAWWETDCHKVPLTPCLHYSNLDLHMLSHKYWAVFIYKYTKPYAYIYDKYIYKYIYIYIYIYFKIGRSTKRFVFFLSIYLFCSYIHVIYVYVSSLLLSSENICGTRPC